MHSRAIVIGVGTYSNMPPLPATQNDSVVVSEMLSHHGDGSKNMLVTLCNDKSIGVSKAILENEIEQTLASDASLVVIYFSGHGTLTAGGDFGQLMASDAAVDMYWLMGRINYHNGKYRSTVVILDCCHAGAIGLSEGRSMPTVQIERGVTLIAAADSTQEAVENNNHGRFTTLLISGLSGGSADLAGRVTPATLYTHIDQAIGHRGQRPVFATCLLYTSPSPRDRTRSRMPSSA